MKIRTIAALAIGLFVSTTLAFAATKDDAVAMVKKTVATIKADGTEKAYAAINTRAARIRTAKFTSLC